MSCTSVVTDVPLPETLLIHPYLHTERATPNGPVRDATQVSTELYVAKLLLQKLCRNDKLPPRYAPSMSPPRHLRDNLRLQMHLMHRP